MYLKDFYRCEDGKLEEAQVNVNIHCKKLVRNMFYDARIIAVRSYKASKGYKMATKTPATKIFLTKEEYMQVNKSCSSFLFPQLVGTQFLFDVYEMQMIN